MLLVTMGTQKRKCDRIINAVINAGIKDDIVIQAYYFPEKEYDNIKFYQFISYDEMEKLLDEADVVVTSGTGSIFRALNKGKKVIIFPRLGRYDEAIDDHGLDMQILKDQGYAEFVIEANDFKKIYNSTLKTKFKKYVSNKENFIQKLEEEISKL